MILIDYNAIAIGNIITQKLDIDENLIRHMILNSIRMYRKRFKKEYGEVVIVADGWQNWRKEVYPQYKASRRKNRDASSLDWNEIFRIINDVREDIKENFPYKVVHVGECEADDAIAHIAYNTQEFGQYEPVMIISADKDFAQLQTMSNVKQYSPMTKKFIVEENPRLQLMNLILSGDGSDGVPNVLSDDDCFVEGRRQTPLTKKKKEAIMVDLEDGELLYAASWYRNYCRNKQLIDLKETPKPVVEKIINTFKEQDPSDNKGKVFPYFVDKRMKNLLESIEEFIS